MKKRFFSGLLCLTLTLPLLTACAGASTGPGMLPEVDALPKGEASITCRVVTAHQGTFLLAQEGGRYADIYWFTPQDLPMAYEDPAVQEIRPGALLEIQYDGSVMETYPAKLGDVKSYIVKADGFDDRCALYLQAMLDLTPEDGALDHGVTYLGVDLSETSLSAPERAAVAWAFAAERELTLLEGTWQELVDQGYINGEELYWEDGVLYDVNENESTDDTVTFSVGKWRSGLGAYRFVYCTSQRDANGHWDGYEIGGAVIS